MKIVWKSEKCSSSVCAPLNQFNIFWTLCCVMCFFLNLELCIAILNSVGPLCCVNCCQLKKINISYFALQFYNISINIALTRLTICVGVFSPSLGYTDTRIQVLNSAMEIDSSGSILHLMTSMIYQGWKIYFSNFNDIILIIFEKKIPMLIAPSLLARSRSN